MWEKCAPCGAKHIWKSQALKIDGPGTLREVEMWKKCKLLWHEAHAQSTNASKTYARKTFGNWDVEKVHVAVARITFGSAKGHFCALQPSFCVATMTTTTTTTTTTATATTIAMTIATTISTTISNIICIFTTIILVSTTIALLRLLLLLPLLHLLVPFLSLLIVLLLFLFLVFFLFLLLLRLLLLQVQHNSFKYNYK